MEKKLTKEMLSTYRNIIFTQPLNNGLWVKEKYEKTQHGWVISYESNAMAHICPYDGMFRNCSDCGDIYSEDFDVRKTCLRRQDVVGAAALIERIGLCEKAGVPVQMWE